jgi:CheY-like chemotaxis protein
MAAARPLRVLVVDDEPLVREVVAEYLRVDSHTATTAADGREGLELFERAYAAGEPFELVVTDRAMPEVGGDQLAAALKQLSPQTPVLMLTGFGDFMTSADELPEGVELVVRKPVTLTVLRQAVAKVTAGGGVVMS